VWHEILGKREREITVPDERILSLDENL